MVLRPTVLNAIFETQADTNINVSFFFKKSVDHDWMQSIVSNTLDRQQQH